jgi:hypothetical protein
MHVKKQAIDTNDIRDILLGTKGIRSKTYFMILAGTRMRALEALSIRRYCDIEFDEDPVKVNLRAEFTKPRQTGLFI